MPMVRAPLPDQPLLAQLRRCSRGDAAVEYVVLLGTMAIPLLPVLVAFGAWLVGVFESIRNLVVLPIP